MSYDPIALECLAAVAEEGGFERAARRLNVTQSAVSQRLRALEAQAGAVLLVRSRPVVPTRAGTVLIRHAKQLRLLRADVDHDLQELAGAPTPSSAARERLSIAVNADSIATWAVGALRSIPAEGIELEVIADDQDFTHEWLRSGQVLGCVTSLKEPLRGCSVTPLGAMRYVCVAAPSFAREHMPNGLTPANFRDLRFVAFNRKDDIPGEFVAKALGLKRVQLAQNFVPSSEGQVRAALAGWGVAVVPELLVRGLIEAGELVDACPETSWSVDLYWHCWNLDSARLRELSDAIVGAARAALSG
jgi:LysR family transcriptional regulator, chromosome initiation inhibitor